MPEIGTKYMSSGELDDIINKNFSNPIAILERWFCCDDDKPDFFNYLPKLIGKASEWDKGRVFDNNSEIRWEKEKDMFHLVWIMDEGCMSEGWSKELITLCDSREILLWGQKVGDNAWHEKQVPRIFEYPPKGSGNMVYAVLNEYRLGDDSALYRFKEVIAK